MGRWMRTSAARWTIDTSLNGVMRRRSFLKAPGNVDKVGPIGYCNPVNAIYATTLGEGLPFLWMAVVTTEGPTGWTDRGYIIFPTRIGRASSVVILRAICSNIGFSVAELGQRTEPYCIILQLLAITARTTGQTPALTSASAESCAWTPEARMERWTVCPVMPRMLTFSRPALGRPMRNSDRPTRLTPLLPRARGVEWA